MAGIGGGLASLIYPRFRERARSHHDEYRIPRSPCIKILNDDINQYGYIQWLQVAELGLNGFPEISSHD